MKRPITGFHRDADAHWVAELSCGHGQHARHDPPFVERAWVLSDAGPSGRLGAQLECVRCDHGEMPAGFAPYRRTAVFDESSVPVGLLADHTTKAGTWAVIHVERGELEYVPQRAARRVLRPGTNGIVLPEVPHHVRPLGPVSFYVEFWRDAGTQGRGGA